MILPANSGSRYSWSHKGLEAGLSGRGRTLAGQPHAYPHKIDRRSRQNLLEMGLRRTSIAGTADAEGPHSLGDGPFNPCALGILVLLSGCPFAWPCGLQAQEGASGRPVMGRRLARVHSRRLAHAGPSRGEHFIVIPAL